VRLRRTPEERALYDRWKAARAELAAYRCPEEDDEYLRLNNAVADAERAMRDAGMPLHLRGGVL
jgi:hypothetical protein